MIASPEIQRNGRPGPLAAIAFAKKTAPEPVWDTCHGSTMPDEFRPPSPPLFFSVSDLAASFGVHPTNVRRLIHQGRLPAHRLGNPGSRWRISEKDLDAFLRSSRIGARWMYLPHRGDAGYRARLSADGHNRRTTR
jgi:excisionase family DNA binding protein